jgi:hypothetical protein
MPKKKDKSWQYTFTTILAGVTLLLIVGYFIQSFIEIRKVKPVTVAMDRLARPAEKPATESERIAPKRDEITEHNE